MIRQKRDAARSRSIILDAAEAEFAQRGYYGASFSDICATAGVSRGLPAYLFGGKDELYRAVVDRAAERLRTATIEPLRALADKRLGKLDDALAFAVDTYVDYLHANPDIVRLLQWEMLADRREDRPFSPADDLFSDVLRIFEKLLKDAGKTDVPAATLLSSFVSLCFFPFMTTIGPAKNVTKTGLAHRKRHIVRLLLRGIS